MSDSMEYTPNGRVQIATEVVEIIAATAAAEVDGVITPDGGTGAQGWAELLGKRNQSKGVKLTVDGEHVTVDLQITVLFGTKLMKAATAVQQKVKNAVETMTYYTVDAVNVSIEAIVMKKEKAEKKEQE